jgi:beta-fructofuranosidase
VSESAGVERLETLDFHVIYDCSVLEIFVNERTALTTRVYPSSGTSIGVKPLISRRERFVSDVETSGFLSCQLWPLSQPA